MFLASRLPAQARCGGREKLDHMFENTGPDSRRAAQSGVVDIRSEALPRLSLRQIQLSGTRRPETTYSSAESTNRTVDNARRALGRPASRISSPVASTKSGSGAGV